MQKKKEMDVLKKDYYDNADAMFEDYSAEKRAAEPQSKDLEEIIDEQEYIDSFPALKELLRLYLLVGGANGRTTKRKRTSAGYTPRTWRRSLRGSPGSATTPTTKT